MTMAPLSLKNILTDPAALEALAWDAFRDGVAISWVYRAETEGGPSAAFLKYAPGARVPEHAHSGMEHILVLEGSQRDENGLYEAGDVVINPTGTQHSVSSEDGCIVLAIWQAPVVFKPA